MATVIWKLYPEERQTILHPEQIIGVIISTIAREVNWDSDLLAKAIKFLKDGGINTKLVDIRNAPGGYWSEEVESFVTRLILFGFATRRKPIEFTKKGVKLISEINWDAERRNTIEVKKIEKLMRGFPIPSVNQKRRAFFP